MLWQTQMIKPPISGGLYTNCGQVAVGVLPSSGQEIVIATGDNLSAFDHSGNLLWSWKDNASCKSNKMPSVTPVITSDGVCIHDGFCGANATLFATNVTTGQILAKYVTERTGSAGVAYTPFVFDSRNHLWTGFNMGLGGILFEFVFT